MEHPLDSHSLLPSVAAPNVRRIGAMRPFGWLRLGASDLAFRPGSSLGIGVLVAVAGLALTAATWNATYLAPALLGGFLLVAPFVAMPLYALSRRREQSAAPDDAPSFRAWRDNGASMALFGLALLLAYFVWERLAAIVFALFFTEQVQQTQHVPYLPAALLLSGQPVSLMLAFFAVGAAVAALAFALSVVSVQLLVSRPVDVITAMLTSLRCCARNPAAMLLWAALIATLTALGFATFMLGLVVIFPWLAHASWHAYREMVDG